MEYAKVYQLADEIRASEEYQTYHSLKESVMGEETTAALIKEYHKLQTSIQMGALGGHQAENEDVQRFSGITGLLFSKPEVRDYLLAEMRLQQALGDIFRIVTEATGLDLGMPGLGK